jgi:hypothetical protein
LYVADITLLLEPPRMAMAFKVVVLLNSMVWSGTGVLLAVGVEPFVV